MTGVADSKVAAIIGGTAMLSDAVAARMEKNGVSSAAVRFVGDAATEGSGGLTIDPRSEDELRGALATVRSEHGPVSILINLGLPTPTFSAVRSETTTHLMGLIDSTVGVALRACRESIDDMAENGGGRIVNLVSFHAFRGVPASAAAAAANGGLLSMSRALAMELAPSGVTVNVVEPGLCWDGEISVDESARLAPSDLVGDEQWPHGLREVLEQGGTPGAAEYFGVLTTPPRPVSADEVAAGIEYLVGPYCASVTGYVLHVNGGMHLGPLSKKPGHPPWAIT